VSNDELADILGLSKGETSKRVAVLNGQIIKQRHGRHVAITLRANGAGTVPETVLKTGDAL